MANPLGVPVGPVRDVVPSIDVDDGVDVEAGRAAEHVVKACALLEISRSAFYERHKHTPSARELADAKLSERIERIYNDSRGTYGCSAGSGDDRLSRWTSR